MVRRCSGWSLALALAALSCSGESNRGSASGGSGGSSGGGSGGSGAFAGAPPIAGSDFPRRLAETHCQNLGPCCTREGYPFDQAACVATFESLFEPIFAAAQAVDTVEYDPEAGGRCVAAYRTALESCDDRSRANGFDQLCEEIFRGLVPQGSACDNDGECSPLSGRSVRCEEGVCTSVERPPDGPNHAELGGACSSSCYSTPYSESCSSVDGATVFLPCRMEEGLYCSLALVCEPVPTIGQPCPTGVCAPGSYCASGQCVVGSATGPCNFDEQCLTTSRCDFDTSLCIVNSDNGEACASSLECQSLHCPEGVCRDWSLANAETCAGAEMAGDN